MIWKKMETLIIEIPIIELEWSEWYPWERFKLDLRYDSSGVKVPNKSGVYEAKFESSEDRLTIGKASNLQMRVKQGLVKGKLPHSTGNRIREIETSNQIFIRWAVTDRPSCVEEELHRIYKRIHGSLPTFTKHT